MNDQLGHVYFSWSDGGVDSRDLLLELAHRATEQEGVGLVILGRMEAIFDRERTVKALRKKRLPLLLI